MSTEQEALFDEMYKAHFENIKNFCNRRLNNDSATAEDIAQTSFSLLYAKWGSLNSHTEKALLAWVYKTAENILKNHYRKSDRIQTLSLDEYIEQGRDVADGASFVDDIIYPVYKEAIEQRLSKRERQLLDYVVNDNFSLFEISVILDENVNTIKSRWRRLRNKLKKIIKNI